MNDSVDKPSSEPVIVPWSELSPDALLGVIESFVLREGTEYGARDYSLEEKVAHVRAQLERGEAAVVYDPETESVTISEGAGLRIFGYSRK